MLDEFINISIKNISRKGIRSWLTMIGIFIGIAAIVSLISLGNGLQAAINEQFELLGFNLVYVTPGGSFGSAVGTGSGSKLTDHELDLIRDVRGVEKAAGMIIRVEQIKYHGETKHSYIAGIEKDSQEILLEGTGIEVVRGQKRFRDNDMYKAAVGYEYWAGNVFEEPLRVEDRIQIKNQRFEVSGEVSRIGNPQDDKNIYIPQDTMEKLFDVEDDYTTIMARTGERYDPEEVAEEIEKELRDDRGLEEGEEDFSVQTTEQIKESVGMILDAVQAVVVGIALISLFVGGVGIMNTMYTSVLERTREIGVMKAVGARNKDIMGLFMVESGILGTLGGIIGIIIGAGLSKAVEFIAVTQLDQTLVKANFSPELILGTLAFSFIVGCLSGLWPAKQAAELKPVDALRYE